MKLSSFTFVLSWAVVSGASAASPTGGAEFFAPPQSDALAAVIPAPAPLRFNHVPLGNVIRILSARFSAPVSLTARATTPITGDFSGLGFRQALTAVAAQAGLVATPLGADERAGYSLALPVPGAGDPSSPGAAPKSGAEVQASLAAAARERAQLLRRREQLQAAADQLGQ